MWICTYCNSENENDDFMTCWNCAVDSDTSLEAIELMRQRNREKRAQFYDCLRCKGKMQFAGTKKFHEGARWGFLGDIGELLVNKEGYDIFACETCGKVELYLDGVGEEYRGNG